MAHTAVAAHVNGGRIHAAGEDGPRLVRQVQTGFRREHIHVGIPERGEGTYVLPVALEAEGRQHLGDDILAKVIFGTRIRLILREVAPQRFPGEHIDAHGCQIALGLAGFFGKLGDHILPIHRHDAEAAGLLPGDLHNGNGAGGVRFLVTAEHFGIIHLIDVVTGEDHHILRLILVDEADVLIDGVGGALVPGAALAAHIGRQDVNTAAAAVQIPGLAGADVAVQFHGPVLSQDADGVNAGVGAVGQGKVDDAEFTAEGDGGLGHGAGEDIQAAALSASQQHSDTLFFHGWISSFSYFSLFSPWLPNRAL